MQIRFISVSSFTSLGALAAKLMRRWQTRLSR